MAFSWTCIYKEYLSVQYVPSSELGHSQPLSLPSECAPPLITGGGGGTLACG